MQKSIAAWAKDAYDLVQGACNLSGIVHSFKRCLDDLAEAGVLANDHAICVCWVDKCDDLSRSRSLEPIPTEQSIVEVVDEFCAVMHELCEDREHGTDWRNQHPRAQECVRKLVHIVGTRNTLAFSKAYDECVRLAGE
jgi:hypothetical protein